MENSNSILAGIIPLGFFFLVCIVLIIANWKIFEKAGKPGWASLIPIYNMWVMGQIIYGDDGAWKPLLMLVPMVGGLFSILFMFRYAQVFGKDMVFCILNIFFPIIILPIIAFSGDTYRGPINSAL